MPGFVEAFVRETSAVMAKQFAYYEILLIDHGHGDALDPADRAASRSISPGCRLVRLSRALPNRDRLLRRS